MARHIILPAVALRYDAKPAVAIKVNHRVDATFGVAVGHCQAYYLSPPQLIGEKHRSLLALTVSQRVDSHRFSISQR